MLFPSVRLALLAVLPLALFLPAHPAGAQTTFTSRASFDTANPGLTSLSFANLAPVDGFADYSASSGNGPLVISGLTFSQPDPAGNLYVISSGYYATSNPPPYALDSSDFLQGSFPGSLDIALPAGAKSFGADFGTFDPSAAPGTITVLVNGIAEPTQISADDSANGTFFGYSSPTPITSLSFVANGSALNLNGVEFGGASAAPETPAAATLCLLGLLGTGYAVRRKRLAHEKSAK